ncbi:hypothetical protein ECANGB1_1178 [Enterospora canceri]|uniref:Uncharacterized protein n=1 Tax=Enterospora canceri TaxID=1081671 RepID=A0A1Y1S6S0_9MICR|nr:hypothetical protein ECANGB1_1178 [Enterospora canceri]
MNLNNFLTGMFANGNLENYADTELFRAIVDEYDMNKAYQLTVENDSFSPFKFWFYRRFMNSQLDAHSYLFTQKPSEIQQLLLCRLSVSSIDNNSDEHVLSRRNLYKTAMNVAKGIMHKFKMNKYKFDEIALLETKDRLAMTKGEYSIKDVLRLLETCDSEIIGEFFKYVDSGEISLKEAKEHLEKIAPFEPKAYVILGDIEYYNLIDTEEGNDVDKAMDYYWAGSDKKNAECFTGLGKIMQFVYEDNEAAQLYYEKSLNLKETSESAFLLANLTGNDTLIAQTALKGYIPAMVTWYEKLLKKNAEITTNNTKSILSVLKYHPHIMEMCKMASEAYSKCNYAKAFLIYLYISEYDVENAHMNVVYLVKKHEKELVDQLGDLVKVAYFDSVKHLSQKNKKFYKELGNCYSRGFGIEQSYEHALGCYAMAPSNDLELLYSIVTLLFDGKGCPRNLFEIRKFINKPVFLAHKLVYYALRIKLFTYCMKEDLFNIGLKVVFGLLTVLLMRMGSVIFAEMSL